MSDIHGEYEKYRKMLDTIHFSDNDNLFILGDIIDRGSKPVSIISDISVRSNVFPLLGNHEVMALDILHDLMVEITEENYDKQINNTLMNKLLEWQLNGGQSTLDEFQKLSYEDRVDLLDFIRDFTTYEIIDIGTKTFILVHSGLGNFKPNKNLDEYSIEELVFCRHDENTKYFEDDDVFVISGHIPTLSITGKSEIYHSNNNICIDCGASFPNGRLACLCLETMQEFYV